MSSLKTRIEKLEHSFSNNGKYHEIDFSNRSAEILAKLFMACMCDAHKLGFFEESEFAANERGETFRKLRGLTDTQKIDVVFSALYFLSTIPESERTCKALQPGEFEEHKEIFLPAGEWLKAQYGTV